MPNTIYVIPDIHGYKAKLDHALQLIEADGGAAAPLVVLGDLVDRGPDSRGVIDMMMAGQATGRDWTVLRGNHDQMFLDFLDRGEIRDPRTPQARSWLDPRRGGPQTLASYGVTASDDAPNRTAALRAVPRAHRDWLAALPLYHETPEILFVHAGIDPGVPLERQTPDTLMNIREPFHSHPDPHPWLVVHGHASMEFPCHYGNRINLDGGAGWGRPLRPAVLEGCYCWLLTDTGRQPLTPAG